MMKVGHGQTNQLHDINWGALDYAFRAPQLMSCDYYACKCFMQYRNWVNDLLLENCGKHTQLLHVRHLIFFFFLCKSNTSCSVPRVPPMEGAVPHYCNS